VTPGCLKAARRLLANIDETVDPCTGIVYHAILSVFYHTFPCHTKKHVCLFIFNELTYSVLVILNIALHYHMNLL
jgi:hypothetical protein